MKYFSITTVTTLVALVALGTSCTKKQNASTESKTTETQSNMSATTTTANAPEGKLEIVDTAVGNGATAEAGKTITVHYTGTLTDGKKFDSSLDRKQPFQFKLGAGQVIAGWDQGVVGMKVGGKRKLTIPSQLAYGERGAGNVIPPNATLVFEVELLKVE